MTHLFYTKLAEHYDKVYHYINYDKQAEFFAKLIKIYNKSKNKNVLDVACGTGTHANLLQKIGFSVTGLDISKEMLREAKKKNPKVNFVLGDMKNPKLKERFGTIICFFNSILYNKNKEEMETALKNFYFELQRGGLLIFDAVDKSVGLNSKRETYEYTSKDLKILFKPKWIYNKQKNALDLDIEFRVNDEKIHDHHIMGAFSLDELKSMLEKIGFSVQILEENFDEIKKYKNKKSAVFVCRKIAELV